MIKIAICDDELKELNKTKEMSQSFVNRHTEMKFQITAFSSPTQLKDNMEQEQFDIVLLDIYMPEMTGTELARIFRERNAKCQIIFLTTSLAHAVEAFSLHAAHYLVKPYKQEQFEDAMTKAITAMEKQKNAQIVVKTILGGMQRIDLADYVYSETERHVQRIYLSDERCLQIRISCMELFEKLSNDKRFFKCGSTYIINLGHVEEVSTRYIQFGNGRQIPMQRRQYKELLERYTGYFVEDI
ncbi:MAG: putative two-component response regulator [Herbinix sp.]|jgi:DNA-binding LytR/AlgR family response regulator|nr:putative two-component response regulator [Herbinix sp.]